MAGDDNEANFMRWAKSSRSAQAEDNVVELVRPLGLVLNQDEQGNVYVETVAPRGNAARTGKVCVCVCVFHFLFERRLAPSSGMLSAFRRGV